MNLTQVVKRAGVNWDDFYAGERDVATVDGKVIGIPALVDNLAVVYNKTLFAKGQACRCRPPTGPWSQFVADAKKLTSASAKQYRGTAYVTPRHRGHGVALGGALLWERNCRRPAADRRRKQASGV